MNDVPTSSQKGRFIDQEKLLDALAEQMKLPLLRIARRAELALSGQTSQADLVSIELTADTALKLIDHYLLSLRLADMHEYLELEPISISAILSSTAHQLYKLAQENNCELRLDLTSKYEPVMVHKEGLEAALSSLGHVFIEGQQTAQTNKRPVVTLAAHRSKNGVVAGLFADDNNVSTELYKKGWSSQAKQSFSNLSATSGAGIFVASSLLGAMSARLRQARHNNLEGLAATFNSSSQLSLI